MSIKAPALLVVMLLSFIGLFAEEGGKLAPPGKAGELVYIPYPVTITVDGDPSDWKTIRTNTVETGPYTAGDSANNGKYDFSLCADKRNIYVLMTMPDKKIIAGKHGRDFWNEDSFEIYFNFSGNLDAAEYTKGIVQINVNATNLKIDDPNGLSLSGVRFEEEGYFVSGKAFQFDGGWGIELAIKLENNIEPYHGFTVGVQTQANGATEKDRDSKLIWSIYDTTDSSWKNPRVFGTGVFYEIGRTDVPLPKRQNLPRVIKRLTVKLEDLPTVRVNQVGYFPKEPKLAVLVSDAKEPLDWELLDAKGIRVASGKTAPKGDDLSSLDKIHHIDFSSYAKEGEGYVLKVGDKSSFPFDISGALYAGLKKDAMAYFYRNRIGIPLEAKYAGDAWARYGIYMSDDAIKPVDYPVPPSREWTERPYTLNAGKGWMDAGDYGKYVVNGGITVWTLLNAYERNPRSFGDGSLSIPESANGIPDILDEVRWELEFFLGMQVPDGQRQAGMVHHKLHEKKWSPLPYKAPERTDDRFAMKPSTAATLNFAASCAQAARLYGAYDKAFADRCLAASEKAWNAAKDNPIAIFSPVAEDGGGDYDDPKVEDEFFWAACELYLTTGKSSYLAAIAEGINGKKFEDAMSAPNGPMNWGNTSSLGMLSLMTVKNKADPSALKAIRSMVIKGADRYLGQIKDEGYRAPFFEYNWGSNSDVLNKTILMAFAYDQTGDKKYLSGVVQSMDYILGRNALCKSFVSGYGEYPMFYPHHRWWGNDDLMGFPPPPPGALSGGVNEKANDDATSYFVKKVGRAKRYADDARSYSTNEVCINWNSPLVWTASWLDAKMNPQSDAKAPRRGPGFVPVAAVVAVLAALAAIAAVIRSRRKK